MIVCIVGGGNNYKTLNNITVIGCRKKNTFPSILTATFTVTFTVTVTVTITYNKLIYFMLQLATVTVTVTGPGVLFYMFTLTVLLAVLYYTSSSGQISV